MSDVLQNKLRQVLQAEHVEVVDNSWMHAGHAGNPNPGATGTHLAVTVVSPEFEGLSLLDRHRRVQKALKEEFAGTLHALELKTFSPAEWASRN